MSQYWLNSANLVPQLAIIVFIFEIFLKKKSVAENDKYVHMFKLSVWGKKPTNNPADKYAQITHGKNSYYI